MFTLSDFKSSILAIHSTKLLDVLRYNFRSMLHNISRLRYLSELFWKASRLFENPAFVRSVNLPTLMPQHCLSLSVIHHFSQKPSAPFADKLSKSEFHVAGQRRVKSVRNQKIQGSPWIQYFWHRRCAQDRTPQKNCLAMQLSSLQTLHAKKVPFLGQLIGH